MWLCASRGRPKRLAEMADSWEATVAKPCKLVLRLDEDDPLLSEYKSQRIWPVEWNFHTGPALQGAAEAWTWFFSRFPHEPSYGF